MTDTEQNQNQTTNPPAEQPNLGGRPSKYSDEVRDEICARLATGESLRSICKSDHLPERMTVHRWIIHNVGEVKDDTGTVIEEGFSYHYTRARDLGLDEMADDLLDIADDGSNDWIEKTINKGKSNEETIEMLNKEAVMRSRLRVDTRKWYLSKMAPKRYGESRKIEHQQLDGEGAPTDAPSTQINVNGLEILDTAKEMFDQVHKQQQGTAEIGTNDTESAT